MKSRVSVTPRDKLMAQKSTFSILLFPPSVSGHFKIKAIIKIALAGVLVLACYCSSQVEAGGLGI